MSTYSWHHHVARLVEFAAERSTATYDAPAAPDIVAEEIEDSPGALATDELADRRHNGHVTRDYKTEVQLQWNSDPCGSQFGGEAEEHTLEWFLTAQKYRYEEYAPWMGRVMEFDRWAGRDVLELGGGMGTDLAQFAAAGARTTDYDLTIGHLSLARENFALRGLPGRFVRGDCEVLPFADNSFDLVYSNGVLHHTPGTVQAVKEIHRVLRPNGRAVVMMYAEMSLHYWRNLVGELGLRGGLLEDLSIGEIMSRSVEMSTSDARPLVKVYRASVLREMFAEFDQVRVNKYQLTGPERPARLNWVPVSVLGRIMGWNLVVKARKVPAA
jgi:SAM-dependent methyltransferase